MESYSNTEAFAMGRAQFAACQRVEEFVANSVRPILDRVGDTNKDLDTYRGAMTRAHAWLRSLRKLDQPADFQAVLAASRTLFEIAVDLTLLNRSPDHTIAHLLGWEDSAKLASADRLQKFMTEQLNGKPPLGAEPVLLYLRERDRVQLLRSQLWGNPKQHPQRWTGHPLGTDAQEADRLNASGFAEYYNVRYPQVCWSVHGSGLTGVRGLTAEAFPALTAFGFAESAHFSLVAARESLELCACWDELSETRFELVHAELIGIRASALSNT